MNFMINNNKALKILNTLKYLLIIVLITIGFMPTSVSSDNGDVPVELQAKLLLTALTYDKSLDRGEDETLHIGLLYFPDVNKSKKEALEFYKVLESYKDKKVRGLNINTMLFAYNGCNSLKSKVSVEHIDVLYIGKAKKEVVKDVIKVTQSNKVLSLTSAASYVSMCGISMAVGLKENKPKIYLNLSSTKAEGADFSAKFLRVVKIVSENNQ